MFQFIERLRERRVGACGCVANVDADLAIRFFQFEWLDQCDLILF